MIETVVWFNAAVSELWDPELVDALMETTAVSPSVLTMVNVTMLDDLA